MKRRAVSALFVAVAAVAVRAQTGGAMPADHKMEQMAPDMTYVGCVEAGSMAKAFVLTHVTAGGEMKPAMKQDSDKKKRRHVRRQHGHDGAIERRAPRRAAGGVGTCGSQGLGCRFAGQGQHGDVERGRRDESHADTEREVGEDGCGDVSVTSAIRG